MKYRAIIRYGAMNHVGSFRADFSGLRAEVSSARARRRFACRDQHVFSRFIFGGHERIEI